MRKTTLSLAALVGLVPASCAEEQGYDLCMEEVSAQTAMPKEALLSLTCSDLLEKLYLPLPADYVTLNDKNVVVFAHCSLITSGTYTLKQNQYCYEIINDFLGIQPITQCFMEAVYYNGDLSELASMYIGDGAARCIMTRSIWNEKKNECEHREEQLPKVESCAPHEPTHLFIAGTVLHGSIPWLNEGLATYASAQLRENETLECLTDGFKYVFRDFYTGEVKQTKEGKYVPLDWTREEHKKNGTPHDAYLTGACVWDHIYSQYGQETFKAVMKEVEASRFACMSFVDDILQHHIGESGIDDLKNKFGDDSIEAFE